MSNQNYPWDAAATLVWLFPGDNLDEEDFDPSWISSPPDENPQKWNTFREAVEYASTTDCYHGKGAWISVSDRIFNPADVYYAFGQLNS